MNNRDFIKLAKQKGCDVTSISGVPRVMRGAVALGNCDDTIEWLNVLPDLEEKAGEAVDLRNLSVAERDAKVLEMIK